MMLRRILALLAFVPLTFAVCLADAPVANRNPDNGPEEPETQPANTNSCKCASSTATVGSIKATIELGRTSARFEGFDVSALVYAREPSPALYTPDVLFVETPYYFRHLSNGRHQDGVTPSGYTFGRQGDEKVVFEFAEGESVANR